jgi:molybdate transport system regulatory protein
MSPRTITPIRAAKVPASRRRLAQATTPVATFRLRVAAGERVAIGPGKIALLEAIARTGSLTAAAKTLDMSYRRAWLLLDEVNRALQQPAVESNKGGVHGGGSALTGTGLELIALYRRIEQTAQRECAGDLRRIFDLLTLPPARSAT